MSRSTKLFLRSILVVVLSAQAASFAEGKPAPAAARPNIVLIMADDIGYECFGCYGSQQYQTPNIDSMAKRGLRFSHCYAQPLCTPTRVKLMTGLSNARNYAAFSVLRRDQKTIGQYFKAAGYQTAVAGKWQLLGAEHYSKQFRGKGTWPREAGFDSMCLWQVDRLGSRYEAPLMYVDGENRQFGKDSYGPRVATDYLLEFMETNRDKPFFIYYPMILVHSPFVPTPDSKPAPNEKKRQQAQRNFADMVAYMDKVVGRIVQKTEALGIARRTLILFVGDNGTGTRIRSTLHGQIIQGGKGKTSDAGTRVPLVALQPGKVPQGKVCDDLVDMSDFLPTTLEAAGVSVPAGLDGRSFLPQLHGQPGTPREWLFCYYNPRPEKTRPTRFVRDQRWKLYGDGRMFDVQSDPLEKHSLENAVEGSAAAAARAKLANALDSMPSEGQSLLKFDGHGKKAP